MRLLIILLLLGLVSCSTEMLTEATEVLGVIRLGVSLVQYINTVVEDVCHGEGQGGECRMDLDVVRGGASYIYSHL